MITKWLQEFIPGKPEIIAINQSALLETNPDLFWIWVVVACVALLLALAQKDYIAFWCFGIVALTFTIQGITTGDFWYTPLADLLLLATGIAAIVFMLDLSNRQRKLTGEGGVGCMWLFVLLIAGGAALYLLTR